MADTETPHFTHTLGVTPRAGPEALGLPIDPLDPRIIKSLINNGSEGAGSAHSQGQEVTPSSQIDATPESPEEIQNEETWDRKEEVLILFYH